MEKLPVGWAKIIGWSNYHAQMEIMERVSEALEGYTPPDNGEEPTPVEPNPEEPPEEEEPSEPEEPTNPETPTDPPTNPEPELPKKVVGLSRGELTHNSVSYTWNDDPTADSFRFEFRQSGTSSWLVDGTTQVPQYILDNLSPQTDYQARVIAVNANGEAEPSSTLSFTTLKAPIQEPVYTLASRPMIDDVAEGETINVSDLRIGSKQKRVSGNYLTIGRDVIIDTDWWTDSDDVVAMRIACHLERLGHINILGVALSTTQDIGPASLDGFLKAESGKSYRISVPKTPHTPTHAIGSFQPALSQLPHTAGTPETMENAVTMYRSLLANAKGKVDIITIGFLNNLEELLKSPADTISPLTGLELVTQKVNMVYTMGGLWPNSQGGNMPGSANEGEYNFAKTPQAKAAASYVLANWPTEMLFSGYTVGYTIFSGSNLEGRVETDNVAKAMQAHGDFNSSPKGRPSWDPLKILLGGAGFDNNSITNSIAPHGYTVVRGNAAVNATNGQNTFTNSSTGKHYYTNKAVSDEILRNRLDSFMLLESQPTKVPVTVRTTAPAPIADNASQGIVDYMHLMEEWVADDIPGEDRTAVASWTGRKRGIPVTARDANNEGILWTSIGGKKAVQYLSDLMDTPSLTLPAEITVYAMVNLPSEVTSGARTFVSQDRAGTSSGRSLHLKTASTSTAVAAAFSGTAGYTDSNGPGRATTNEWHVFTAVRTATSIEAFYNGTTDGPTAVPNSNVIDQTVTFGGRGIGSEYMVGDYMHSVRIYFAAHNQEQVNQVIAEMKAN